MELPAKKILIVDDEELNRILLRDMVEHLGHVPVLARDGAQALALVDRTIDLVLMDVMMPVMDGYEAVRRIRRMEEFAELPIIMVTALANREDRLLAVEAGASDFIAKPVDFTELRVRTESLLKIKESRDAIQIYQRELEELVRGMRKLSRAIEQTADHIVITDNNGVIEYVNPAFEAVTGFSREEVIGRTPAIMNSGRHDRAFFEVFWKTILSGRVYKGVFINRKKSREVFYNEITVTPIKDPSGAITHFVSSGRDITERELRDPVTGLPTRTLFMEMIENAIEMSRRKKGCRYAVIIIDVDDFTVINNTYGFAAGDQFLGTFARRIEQSIEADDLLAHLDGDKFGLLLDCTENQARAMSVAGRIQAGLEAPFEVDGGEVFTSASMGIVISPPEDADRESIMRDAEIALKRARSRGTSFFEVFNADMLSSVMKRVQMATLLRKALERGEFFIEYQPIVSVRGGAIVSFEALVRWNHPEAGIVPPVEFIPLAEETGLIVPLGEWVLRRSCEHIRMFHEGGFPGVQVAVNISARQFQEGEDIISMVKRVLDSTGLPAGHLKLEITETTAARNPELAIDIFNRLKAMGVTLLIDDFGTGYSNLNYLKRFPVDILKIDRSFIMDIPFDPDSVSIARTIIAMAHNLGLEVLAEGVETDEQWRFLADEGCDLIQGYLVSRPVPPEKCLGLLGSYSSR